MFYKKIKDIWFIGEKVSLPNGVELNENNKQSIDGWLWHNEPPQEYLDWLEEQENYEEEEGNEDNGGFPEDGIS